MSEEAQILDEIATLEARLAHVRQEIDGLGRERRAFDTEARAIRADPGQIMYQASILSTGVAVLLGVVAGSFLGPLMGKLILRVLRGD